MKMNPRKRSARIARMRRQWRSLSYQTRLTLKVTVVLAVLAAVPSYLALFDNRDPERSSAAAPPGVNNTSLRQPSSQGALRLDAAYNRTRESIVWATARELPPEDDAVIQAPNLVGNDPAQSKIAALLVKRGGVKIEADETEDFRPHSQVRLVVTGQHERPVLITGLRANVLRRERPLSQTHCLWPATRRGREHPGGPRP